MPENYTISIYLHYMYREISNIFRSSRGLLGCDAVWCGRIPTFRRYLLLEWRWRQRGPLKPWYPAATLHGVTAQKTSTWT